MPGPLLGPVYACTACGHLAPGHAPCWGNAPGPGAYHSGCTGSRARIEGDLGGGFGLQAVVDRQSRDRDLVDRLRARIDAIEREGHALRRENDALRARLAAERAGRRPLTEDELETAARIRDALAGIFHPSLPRYRVARALVTERFGLPDDAGQ